MEKETAIFKLLADQTRLRLAILLVIKGETCVCQLSQGLNEPEYKISRHLRIMLSAGLVEKRRQGTWMYYSLSEPTTKLESSLRESLKSCFLDNPITIQDIKRLEKSICDIKERKMVNTDKIKVLFLCTGNSCRSQMAEGWARYLKGDVIESFSAGIETHGLNSNALKVMAEAGVDISGHKSQLLSEFDDIEFDYVVTVCGHANESCPVFNGKTKVVHVGFDDPPRLAKEAKNEQEALDCYRRVRDEIKNFVETLPESLNS
ncbi:MAG: metalloregulator ArsR/SmtB family transcription factor [Phycisphaerae bacterium]|nr:metalloregulator ArsR/SmtB family transcription factor [Phycisphaerae bacterium]